MEETLGQALAGFDATLTRFRDALAADPALSDTVFADTADWSALLSFKLVPHLAGEGCLVAAVTGGTNTGKSTVFNRLLGHVVSPVLTTAAATRHPLLAGSRLRAGQCLEAKLLPELTPRPLEDPDAMVRDDVPFETLFVTRSDALPDRLVLMDTPDVDSIDKQNWEVADNIRAAGDVLIAVLTAEKYKDARVVEFFRRARESGRVVVPVMNKADPTRDFDVARTQLDAFCADVGITDGPRFVVPHGFDVAQDVAAPIRALDGATDLQAYLTSLDVPAIKHRVYRDTVAHFADRAGAFLDRCAEVGDTLRRVADEFDTRTVTFAARYDPAPGAEIGGLFHEFVQAKRGPARRAIGSASAAVAKGVAAVATTLVRTFRKRTRLESPPQDQRDAEIRAMHARALGQITRDLAASYVESSTNLREPAAHMVEAALSTLDIETVVEAVTKQTLRSHSISTEFRQHARDTIEAWWRDHAGKRRILEALDTVLAVMPAAIAAPISMYSAGVGVSEAIVLAGPFVEQFVARVLEYQFGDQMFDLLSPWQAEQQRTLEEALRQHLATPCLAKLHAALEPFDGDVMAEMTQWHAACQNAVQQAKE